MIELHSVVSDRPPGAQWIFEEKETGRKIVKERWTWTAKGKGKRQGFNVDAGEWDTKTVPWGATNVAKGRRATPHLVSAFDDPKTQTKEILDLLTGYIVDELKRAREVGGAEGEPITRLLNEIGTMRDRLVQQASTKIKKIETDISLLLGRIFPQFAIRFEPKSSGDDDALEDLFTDGHRLVAGYDRDGAEFLPIELQGSGARRTLLWAALKLIAESGRDAAKKGRGKADVPAAVATDSEAAKRPHVLLMDEPELCLHPSAIRDARGALYDLPDAGNWQVIVTTHSPLFIDLSRDNTTIVRVERGIGGAVQATTLFHAERIKLSQTERDELKLLNAFDPHVAEFFFGGRSVIVEGDTEYVAFKYAASRFPDEFPDLHVVRARGKSNIVILCRILNQFGASYGVLHDSDHPHLERKKKDGTPWGNSAWTVNDRIRSVVSSAPSSDRIVHRTTLYTFEVALFGKEASGDKPYRALETLRESDEDLERVCSLLRLLTRMGDAEIPGVVAWTTLEELKTKYLEATTKCKEETSDSTTN